MIIKEFIIKKSTHLYILAFTIIIMTLLTLNSIKIGIELSIHDIYTKRTIFIVKTQKDLKNKLVSNEYLEDVQEALVIPLSNNKDILILDDKINFQINNAGFDNLIIYNDINNELKENEVLLGLDSTTYENIKPNIQKYIGRKIIINYYDSHELTIKSFYDSKEINELKVSNNVFNEIVKREKKYTYISRIKKEKYEPLIENDFLTLKKEESDFIDVISFSNSSGVSIYENLEEYLIYLTYIILILNVMFLLMIIIIYKNILTDMKKNIKLEKIFGFFNKKIKINILKRFSSINIIATSLAIIFSLSINKLLEQMLKIEVVFSYKHLIAIVLIELLANLLLIGTINNKLNITKSKS